MNTPLSTGTILTATLICLLALTAAGTSSPQVDVATGDINAADRPFYAPRNSGIGPNYYSTNLRLQKSFGVTKSTDVQALHAELIIEATNVFNRTNFLRVNDTICDATCDPKFLNGPFDFKGSKDIARTAPLGFTAAHPARQLQFGLKLLF